MAGSSDDAAGGYRTSDEESMEQLSSSYVSAIKDSLEAAAAELTEEESRDLLVFVVGDANAGKSSIINKLLGENRAETKAVPGWTRESALYLFAKHLYVVDTPGLNETNTAELGQDVTVDVRHRADIILFILNLAGNRTPQEIAAYREIKQLNRPTILVANKVDVVPAEDRVDVSSDLSVRFGVTPGDISFVSALTAEGIESLSLRIFKKLDANGGGLLWAKNARHRDTLVRNLVLSSAAAAAGVGASPIPFSDMIPLSLLQSRMWVKIGKIYGQDVSKDKLRVSWPPLRRVTWVRPYFGKALKRLAEPSGSAPWRRRHLGPSSLVP